jgi:tRNA A-37 threonylcarbamoyl transferase component Bud32
MNQPTAAKIRSAHAKAVGGGRKRCRKGKNCSATCIAGGEICLVELPEPVSIATSKLAAMVMNRGGKSATMGPLAAAPTGRTEAQQMGAQSKQARIKAEEDKVKQRTLDSMAANQAKAGFGKPKPQNPEDLKPLRGGNQGSSEPDYGKWNEIKRGNYGKVSISPDGTRAVKELLTDKDGKKGEFGEYEVQLAKRMGQLGHSPRIHRATQDALEMDVAKGQPLWKDYKRGEGEPRMNGPQATKAAAAIQALHKLGFAHGDMHALQFLVDGNNVKLVDYGLSVPTSRQPVRVLQDLSKINPLIDWKNPELAGNRYVQLVNKYLDPYKEIKGTSQKAKQQKQQLAEAYLRELEQMQ